MADVVAITKRVDLSDLADGWDDCCALLTSAPYGELVELNKSDVAAMSVNEAALLGIETVKRHLVGGQIRVFDGASTKLVPLTGDHIDSSRELADRLVGEVFGVIRDPKASSTTTETSPTDGASIEPSS